MYVKPTKMMQPHANSFLRSKIFVLTIKQYKINICYKPPGRPIKEARRKRNMSRAEYKKIRQASEQSISSMKIIPHIGKLKRIRRP